jgi:hypothetical protein
LNISWRLHYLWNSTNPDTNVQPGQAIHLNFATSIEVLKGRLHMGVKRLLPLPADPQIAPLRRPTPIAREAWSASAGRALHLSNKDLLFFNTYFEVEAKPHGGDGSNFRWVHKF